MKCGVAIGCGIGKKKLNGSGASATLIDSKSATENDERLAAGGIIWKREDALAVP